MPDKPTFSHAFKRTLATSLGIAPAQYGDIASFFTDPKSFARPPAPLGSKSAAPSSTRRRQQLAKGSEFEIDESYYEDHEVTPFAAEIAAWTRDTVRMVKTGGIPPPDNFCELFTTLRLNAQRISEVDGLLFDFANLEELSLTGNEIDGWRSLFVDAAGAPQQSHSREQRMLKSLKVLHLSANRITSPISLLPFTALQHVGLSHNSISEVPRALVWLPASVISLDLSFNELTELAALIDNLSTPRLRIKILSLIGNPLFLAPTYRRALITQLTHLAALDDVRVTSTEREQYSKPTTGEQAQAQAQEFAFTLRVRSLRSVPNPQILAFPVLDGAAPSNGSQASITSAPPASDEKPADKYAYAVEVAVGGSVVSTGDIEWSAPAAAQQAAAAAPPQKGAKAQKDAAGAAPEPETPQFADAVACDQSISHSLEITRDMKRVLENATLRIVRRRYTHVPDESPPSDEQSAAGSEKPTVPPSAASRRDSKPATAAAPAAAKGGKKQELPAIKWKTIITDESAVAECTLNLGKFLAGDRAIASTSAPVYKPGLALAPLPRPGSGSDQQPISKQTSRVNISGKPQQQAAARRSVSQTPAMSVMELDSAAPPPREERVLLESGGTRIGVDLEATSLA